MTQNKPAFLKFGIDANKEWISIEDVASGKTSLTCPFCDRQLIARKGQQKEHHFAHNGTTCRESKAAVTLSQIPTIDRFEFLSKAEEKYLERRKKYQHKDIYRFNGWDDAVKTLRVMGILDVQETYTDRLINTRELLGEVDPALLDDGMPSEKLLQIFDALKKIGATYGYQLNERFQGQIRTETKINRAYHTNKLDKQGSIAKLYKAQKFWLDCYYKKVAALHPEVLPLVDARFANLASQHLYLFEIDNVIKIGMTTREPEIRLSEVVQELGEADKAEVLRFVPYAGRVEFLAHQLHKQFLAPVGNHREYFKVVIKERLLEEFDALIKSKPVAYEPPVIKMTPSPTPTKEKEQVPKRQRRGKTKAELLEGHADIVEALQKGLGVRAASRETGKSANTVQKVKAALER